MSGLRALYQETIIDHSKQPRNFGQLPDANLLKQGFNPLCGDKLTLHICEKNELVQDICFEGSGCAISVASASLMTEAIKGKTKKEIEALFQLFHQLVTEGNLTHIEELAKLAVFAGVVEFPARVKCATLAWHTLQAALNADTNPVSTE